MGQAEILDLLEKKLIPLASQEIAKLLDDDQVKILKQLNKLIQQGEVKYKVVDRFNAMEYFNSKRKLRVFFASNISKEHLKEIRDRFPYI